MNEEICPRCGNAKFKRLWQLDPSQRFLAERLYAHLEASPEEAQRHRFCSRCLYKIEDASETTA